MPVLRACCAQRTDSTLPNLRGFSLLLAAVAIAFSCSASATPPAAATDGCANSSATSVESPTEIASRNGRLRVSLRIRSSLDSAGQMHYCYLDEHGDRSPTLRLRPGDLLLLSLTNEITPPSAAGPSPSGHEHKMSPPGCASSPMAADATNLHFHGLNVSPGCHSDDTLRTSIRPGAKPFLYSVRIPRNQPPGLYWYHPHVHGYTEEQVLGGASGAIIIEGMTRANPAVSGLPERVFVIRDQLLDQKPIDQKLLEEKLAAQKTHDRQALTQQPGSSAFDDSNPPAPIHDPRHPAKDLSINFIPVPYPDYPVPAIQTRPLTREFWRVLNASADTYVNLGVLFNGEWQATGLVAKNGSWQPLDLVALDGVPVSRTNSSPIKVPAPMSILIPPGGRAEFIVQTPPEGIKAELITAGAETHPPEDEDSEPSAAAASGTAIPDTDDFTPPRPLARIVSSGLAVEPQVTELERMSSLVPARSKRDASASAPAAGATATALARISPVRQRKLYFSEKITDLKHPATSTIFYITEESHAPKAFDPSAIAPDIIVHQGDVEDWTIENRSTESHTFHIHQSHFLFLERDHEPASEGYLLDTVDLPYWDGTSTEFPSVKLRMDFRGANTVGIFPYHCHILQHADGGMMGLIEVRAKARK